MKRKLNIDEQIEYMMNAGISFNYFCKEDAKVFLSENNYYFKIKAYSKNYNKDSKHQYVNVDFKHLVELSTIDMYFRRIILRLCLDCEHLLKVRLNNNFCNNNKEDGYSIIKEFEEQNPKIFISLQDKSKGDTYHKDLLFKYKDNFALWNLIEVLSFGEFIKFYKFYYDKIGSREDKRIYQLCYAVNKLRNAAAHNNCTLNHLKNTTTITPNKYLVNIVNKINKIPSSRRNKWMRVKTIHDFTALLILFDKLCKSQKMKVALGEELNTFLKRCLRSREYFKDNKMIRSAFLVVFSIVKHFFN